MISYGYDTSPSVHLIGSSIFPGYFSRGQVTEPDGSETTTIIIRPDPEIEPPPSTADSSEA